jgi:hypothetical protein
MEYIIIGVVLVGFAYFIYTRISKKRKATTGVGGGGGGRGDDTNTVLK